MSKFSCFILLIAIIIGIIPFYFNFEFIKKLLGEKEYDENLEDKKNIF